VGGFGFVLLQFSSGAWALFATQTPTTTFTPTFVLPTATRFIPSDTPTIPATATRGAPITYTVVAGDSITSIGQKFGVDAETLIAYNKLTQVVLSIGQQLAIPPSDFVYIAPTVTPIPTNLRPGTFISYTIKAGDTLGAIAEKFNSRTIDIINANTQVIRDPNNIPVGSTVRIPYNRR
jgi:LysM repeat protein